MSVFSSGIMFVFPSRSVIQYTPVHIPGLALSTPYFEWHPNLLSSWDGRQSVPSPWDTKPLNSQLTVPSPEVPSPNIPVFWTEVGLHIEHSCSIMFLPLPYCCFYHLSPFHPSVVPPFCLPPSSLPPSPLSPKRTNNPLSSQSLFDFPLWRRLLSSLVNGHLPPFHTMCPAHLDHQLTGVFLTFGF